MTDQLSRRRFAEIVSLAAGSLAFAAIPGLADDAVARPETPDLITGPFYPQIKPREQDPDLTKLRGHDQRAAGQIVHVHGRVLNARGEPVCNVRMEVWQANSYGRYAHESDRNIKAASDPHFQGYAVLRTDNQGNYRFSTIKPGPYPTPRGDMRAPHIHFEVQGRIDRKVTQLFFPGEALNDQDRHLRSARRPESLIASVSRSVSGGTELIAEWDIVLATG